MKWCGNMLINSHSVFHDVSHLKNARTNLQKTHDLKLFDLIHFYFGLSTKNFLTYRS